MGDSDNIPVTRIACFKFLPTVTPEQKADRTHAFLGLYAKHQDLIVEMPKGGRPLNTPLKLTNVKRETGWDTGFVVQFKVNLPAVSGIVVDDDRMMRPEKNLTWFRNMIS